MKKKFFLNLAVMLVAGTLAAADTTLDFTALNELPKNINSYGSNAKLELGTVNGKKAVQSKILRMAKGRNYGGISVTLKNRIPWDQFDAVRVTILNTDKAVTKVHCIIYDEANNVWRTDLPASFDDYYTFQKDAFNYNYTESKIKPATPPTEKLGKIKLIVISADFRKGDEQTINLTIPEIIFEKKEQK